MPLLHARLLPAPAPVHSVYIAAVTECKTRGRTTSKGNAVCAVVPCGLPPSPVSGEPGAPRSLLLC